MIRRLFQRTKATPEDRRTSAWTRKYLGITPRDIALYHQALRHSSSIPEDRPDLPNNERLEFLGDAILDAIVGSLLFTVYPDKGEGFLTRMRSKLVSRQRLNELARKVDIERVISSNVSRGHETSVPGNALEAVIGALYLDKGFERTRKALEKLISEQYDLSELEKQDQDNKSKLLEWGQKNKRRVAFKITEEKARNGRGKLFLAEALVDGKLMGSGRGNSKKKAEQQAADQAFMKVRAKRRSRGRRKTRDHEGAAAEHPVRPEGHSHSTPSTEAQRAESA
ncbi:MAG: ribonuclease III [Flavobacteriales bacterium]|nr:ribonuclease III [Flavobacteriales bacterium]